MDPSSKGPRTRSQSQSRTPSPHPEGASTTTTVGTPSHRTDKPWTEVVKGASTPRNAATAPPKPDHPFESDNPYTSLRPPHDDLPDDGSRRSEDLLTPEDLLQPDVGGVEIHPDVRGADVPPNDNTTPPVSAVADPPLDTLYHDLHGTHPEIPDVLRLRDAQWTSLLDDRDAGLTKKLDTSLKTRLDAYFDRNQIQTASYLRRAQEAQLKDFEAYQSQQEENLRALLPAIVKAEFDPIQASLPAIVRAEFEPLKASLPEIVRAEFEPLRASLDSTAALAAATVEAAFDPIRSSFDATVTALEHKVTNTLGEFERRLDALHGSSYGHLTKTTIPEMKKHIDSLEARLSEPRHLPANKADPSSDDVRAETGDVPAVGADDTKVGADDTKVDAMARSRTAWASAHARNGMDPTTAGPPRASYDASPTPGRGLPRTPVTPNPYRPAATTHRDQPSLRQTTLPEYGSRSAPRPTVHTAHDVSNDRRSPFVGGPIVSPRHSDRAIHARTLGASRFDLMRLATVEYHVGTDGCDLLTEDILQECGYAHIKASVDDVVVCYNDIILVHHKVRELWYNSYAHTSGPQVDKILHKSLSVFPKLTTLRLDDVVGFYDRLQEVSMGYSLVLMLFDAVVLKNRFEGLCPPGLGLV